MMPPKQSLGKGLGAMFPDLLNHVGDRPAFILCGIEELSPNRFQPRQISTTKTRENSSPP